MAQHTNPYIVELPVVRDPRGNLSFIQHGAACPFHMHRCYWIYDVPTDSERHGRALRNTHELIVAMSGCFDVEVTFANGNVETFHLDRAYRGLYLPPLSWRRICGFSAGCVAMVLASSAYNPDDYIFDFNTFANISTDEHRISQP